MYQPAWIRIRYYQQISAYNYKRARMMRNARNPAYRHFAAQAKHDAEKARALLFSMIDKGVDKWYAGYLGD